MSVTRQAFGRLRPRRGESRRHASAQEHGSPSSHHGTQVWHEGGRTVGSAEATRGCPPPDTLNGYFLAAASRVVTIVVRPIPVNASHNFPLTIHGDQTAGTNTIQVSGVGVTPLFSASGIVRDEVDGAPIAGAEVRIQTGHYVGLVTTTDGNGYYSIGGIAGDVGLIAHKAGYTSFGHFVTMLSDTRLDMTLRRSSR